VILHQEPLLKEWCQAGIKEVDKMSNTQLDVGWVYGGRSPRFTDSLSLAAAIAAFSKAA
jgi:hypothetical protein